MLTVLIRVSTSREYSGYLQGLASVTGSYRLRICELDCESFAGDIAAEFMHVY